MRTGNKNIAACFACAFGAAFLAMGTAAYAETVLGTQGIVGELKSLTESLNLISAIKTGKTPTDPVALQTALNAVISLSQEEAKSLRAQLAAIENLDDDREATRANYLKQLDEFLVRYGEIGASLNRDLEANEVIRIGLELKQWRDAIYTLAIQAIADFTAVFTNKNAVDTANARLVSILKDERRVKSAIRGTSTGAFLKSLRDAQEGIFRATKLNRDAQTLLGDPDAGDTLDSMIASSAQLLDDAYENFIAMGRLMKR